MINIFDYFRNFFRPQREVVPEVQEPKMIVPEAVDLPLPKPSREQIAVPASINGRDLSSGKL